MTISQFQKTILSWRKKNRRDMPWRKTKDPYKILVSEVMLQQTQVARVEPKYREFLKAFPTLSSLAKAKERKLLSAWRGLGYWKRAVSLKRAAKELNKGRFPKTPEALEKLPGIGPYTSKALSCFAFQNMDAFLDTNIRKVYLHFFFPDKTEVSDKEIERIAKKAVWKENPREWHYALFDYGALVLKDKKLARRSKHHKKQSPFEGSFRSFRTKVMRFLLDQTNQAAQRRRIKKLLKEVRSPFSAEKVLASLVKDGLLKQKGALYSL